MWTRLFFLFFLIPTLIHADFREKDCRRSQDKLFSQWQKSEELILQSNNCGSNDQQKAEDLLREAIACCQKALNHCEYILEEISKKSKKERKKWAKEIEIGERDREILKLEINSIETNIALKKANILHEKSGNKAALAHTKYQNCPSFHLNNEDATVTTLNEIAQLYEEAASIEREALSLLYAAPISKEENKALLKETLESYQAAAEQCRKEAADLEKSNLAQKEVLRKRLVTLKEDAKLFEEKGLKRSSYEVQNQIYFVLEDLVQAGEASQDELAQVRRSITDFETQVDSSRVAERASLLSKEEFREREKKRRELFFKSDQVLNPDLFLQSLFSSKSRPYALPLDGGFARKDQTFDLYAQQFYRFLVQSDVPLSEILIKVYEKDQVVHEEKIALPIKGTLSWEKYLTADGMVFIPETKLKFNFGLDLRLSFIRDPKCNFSMVIAQKGNYSGYRFDISLGEGNPLYACNLLAPPPWQLDVLRKPAESNPDRLISKNFSFPLDHMEFEQDPQEEQFLLLDQLVDQLKRDPMALAGYVQNEIALDHTLLFQKDGVFQAPGIKRNPGMTFLERQGSPWEQCQLLVYLLRKAGYSALYVTGDKCHLTKNICENMFFAKLPDGLTEGVLEYPWVLFSDGKKWIPLFPWMKEVQVGEGYDLYGLMPEEYASADRWILRYLKGDEEILKHIGPNKDDSAGVLFVRFVGEILEKQGLSLSDVGLHRTQIKKQFVSWGDFPRLVTSGENPKFLHSLDKNSSLFAKVDIEIPSHENPDKKISKIFPLVDLDCNAISLRSTDSHLHVHFIGELEDRLLDLDSSDQKIDIKIGYTNSIGLQPYSEKRSICMDKGTEAALCFYLGASSSKVTSEFYRQFSLAKDEDKNRSLLAFLGASYFEKCSSATEALAKLHKLPSHTDFAFGLAKFAPIGNPQIDMIWLNAPEHSLKQEAINPNFRQLAALLTVDASSNEHRILFDIFGVNEAISTVKLLQLAHLEQQKKGLSGLGFLTLTPSSMKEAGDALDATSGAQWNLTKELFEKRGDLDAYAYMTPGPVSSLGGSIQETGTLIIHPEIGASLISANDLVLNGGIGLFAKSSEDDDAEFSQPAWVPPPYIPNGSESSLPGPQINDWKKDPNFTGNPSSYPGYVPSPPNRNAPPVKDLSRAAPTVPEFKKITADVRLEHKPLLNKIADPVDVVTGAFYVDEIDLVLPGPFPLEIRRNYNSQTPIMGEFGCGWKLGFNPLLIKQDGKLYVSETDGTVIVYSYNPETFRWEVFPEDNPELCYFGSNLNPFHTYIEEDVLRSILYGPDGSKRTFKEGLLRTWVDCRGNTLTFSYSDDKLSKIESSNGDFCGVLYNHEGKISEIYSKDGRRFYYGYDSRGDLTKITLPNTAVITYEYDREHRIIRETKPHGKVLANIYKDGRVAKQLSPVGPQQMMVAAATFDYEEGQTTVMDAEGGKTTYKIFENQIYKVIDPLGYETLRSWFIDEKSWFDAAAEKVTDWNQTGGAARSLKESKDKRGLTTYYLYDDHGNPIEIGLKGNDLTGSGKQVISKKLKYNDHNLCIEEDLYGQKTITSYDSIFSYLPKRVETYSGDALISYVDLEYNSLGQIIKEDHSGAITLLEYDPHGLLWKRTQVTGTDDPNVIITYSYNHQGQCTEMTFPSGMQKSGYDIMGNLSKSETFSLSGKLLSSSYMGYDLNNAPIWKKTANNKNTLYIDYHASGLIKASRQTLSPDQTVAYTLYEYDSRGYLEEEVDPRGYTTYREYDPLGNVVCETKEELSTLFTYEPGGLLETITSPSGAKKARLYTTNGLLKEEIYPDETKNSFVYDFFGRLIRETKNDITWEIKYDDAHHRSIRTQLKTKHTEISEFDLRGNLIRFTDVAGFASEKTYDGLNRLKTEISPSGLVTTWDYQGDTVICTLPSGEKRVDRYEGGQVAESRVFDAKGSLIASSSYHYDPETDIQTTLQGEEITTAWMNALGLPIKVQKGNITTTYGYDSCGNCIAMTDGDGRILRQTFDGLGRIIQKEMSDGALISYGYDLDSNLAEYQLPNGSIWKALYDGMGRKIDEKLEAGEQSSLYYEYTYENGYLKELKDPMERTHTYLYDLSGRLSQETVNGWSRAYTYDPRGYLLTAQQIGFQGVSGVASWFYAPQQESSRVERSYDADGRLSLESIYLNSNLIQQTKQTWDASSRSLQIGDHTRDFTYQNNQLIEMRAGNVDFTYAYDLSGSLKRKSSPLGSTVIGYNASGLPENIHTNLPNASHQETLKWYPSGKLRAYSSPKQQKHFTYTSRGYLQFAGAEKYDFDFGVPGIGVRTVAPNRTAAQNGIDPFGKIFTEISDKKPLATTYDPMGQAIIHDQKQLDWDPWGRLIKVTDPSYAWEASYDALGRRLQTRYTQGWDSTLTTTSFYDPEEEFQEIGVKVGNKTFWKIYGPNSCDAVIDETGARVFLMHNALDQLAGVISKDGIFYTEQFPSSYGLQSDPFIPRDLLSYAQSLSWHSQAQDPTSLIWMGERYYDAKGGRFLSPDSVGYPICLDLYAYASGDPVNYMDPDGRFFSPVYQPIKATVLNTWHSPRFHGSMQAFEGLVEAGAGSGMTYISGGLAAPLGWPIMAHGLDQFFTGMQTVITGRYSDTVTSQILQKTGLSPHIANTIDGALSISNFMGAAYIIQQARTVAFAAFRVPESAMMGFEGIQEGLNFKPFMKNNIGGVKTFQGELLNTHLTQVKKYGSQGYRQLQNNKIRYYGELKAPMKEGEMIGRRRVREWAPETGLKKTWHETLDKNNVIRIVRPEINNGIKTHYIFDSEGNFIGIR